MLSIFKTLHKNADFTHKRFANAAQTCTNKTFSIYREWLLIYIVIIYFSKGFFGQTLYKLN